MWTALAASALLLVDADRVVVVPGGGCGAGTLTPALATSVVVDPRAPDRALTVAGIAFRTTGRGECLVASDDGLEPRPPFFRPTEPASLAIDLSNPETVYLGSVQGVFKSGDGGLSWDWRSAGIPFALGGAGVAVVTVDPSRPEVLYAGSWYGAFKSVNGADSWFGVNQGLVVPPFITAGVSAFAFDPRDTDVVYAASLGLFKTGSGGIVWQRSSDGLPAGRVWEVAVDAADPDIVYAGTDVGLYRSSDAAGIWVPLALDGIAVHSLSQDEDAPDFIVAGTDNGVFATENRGESWNLRLPRDLSGAVSSVAIAPSDSETLYAAAQGGLFVSRDRGRTWSVLPLAAPPTRLVPPR